MHAGFGKEELTPPMGVELAGYGYYLGRKAESVRDPLYARTLLLEENGTRALVVSWFSPTPGNSAFRRDILSWSAFTRIPDRRSNTTRAADIRTPPMSPQSRRRSAVRLTPHWKTWTTSAPCSFPVCRLKVNISITAHSRTGRWTGMSGAFSFPGKKGRPLR